MQFDAWTPERRQAGAERNAGMRWDTENRARVVTDEGTAVIVPHISNYSAILCAAEILKRDPVELMDAAVWMAPSGSEVGVIRQC